MNKKALWQESTKPESVSVRVLARISPLGQGN